MLHLAYRNLTKKKSRTALSVLGLVLGVTIIIVLISITLGLKATINDILSEMKGVIVMEKDAVDQSLSFIPASYGDEIEDMPGVRVVLPEVYDIATSVEGESPEMGSMSSMVTIMGVDPAKEKLRRGGIFGFKVNKGRMLEPNDRYSVVIGSTLAEEHDKYVGSTIELEDTKFKVIGIYDIGEGMAEYGRVAMMHIDTARDITGFPEDEVSDFTVQTHDPEYEEKLARRIEAKYDDVDASTVTEFTEEFAFMMDAINAFFWVIAAVGITIGGIGIINTMLMSVMERTKEFGVLRSVGWTSDNIIKLVLSEAILLGVAGGIIGCITGTLLVRLTEQYIGFKLLVTPELLISAIIFSITAGAVGGLYPAWRAGKLDPIEAIHEE
jgi:putative ABC transport system permease protein